MLPAERSCSKRAPEALRMSASGSRVKEWIARNGGLTTEIKKITNGLDLWKIVDPCPEDF